MLTINNLSLQDAKPTDYPHLQLTLQDYQRDCLEAAKEIRQYIRNVQYHLDDEFKQYGKEIYVDVR